MIPAMQSGEMLLHYRLTDRLGQGGMGEVWRARDTTLDRDVAIKVLPAAFAADQDRLLRFEREAKVLASLNHPNIAAIHGFHDAGGQRFLAMEFVPGDDLAVRLTRGPVPVDEAIALAKLIAEGLEYAHERGIVHRDLKPANIKVTPDGIVKILDFGLAKALAPDLSSSNPALTPTMVPTVTSAGTAMGVILGTAAYMSPEQARGRAVDKRADNWAFGAVLYELLTGRRLFDGETVTDVLAAVVTREPDWNALPAATPASVRQLLMRCLDKDARTRLRDIGEARVLLTNPAASSIAMSTTGTAAPVSIAAPPSRTNRWSPLVAALTLAGGVALGRYVLTPATPPPPMFEFDVTNGSKPIEKGSLALSPDGTRLAFVVRDQTGERRLAVREMRATELRVFSNTHGVVMPFWSPDGQEIAFFSNGELDRVSIDGTAVRTIGPAVDPRGGTWNAKGVILFGSGAGPIMQIQATGGISTPATKLSGGTEDAHCWPVFLPDGDRFIYLADGTSDEAHQLRLTRLSDSSKTTLLKQGPRSAPLLDPDGRVLLTERGQLVAYPFDISTGTLGAQSTIVASEVYSFGNQHNLPASTGPHGLVAFQTGSPDTSLLQLDHEGHIVKTIASGERFGNPSLSRDGRSLLFEIFTDTTERFVWAYDLARGVRTPLSERNAQADGSVWGPDSQTAYFDSNATKKWEAYRRTVTGGAPEKLGTMPDATGTWRPWADSPADELTGTFSPDSRWITYTSDLTGRSEIYVAPVDGGPAKYHAQISTGGGFEGRFSPDGRTLYYRSATSMWMAVAITLGADTVTPGAPKELFALPPLEQPYMRNQMVVMPDGKGFITVRATTPDVVAIRVRTGR